MARALGGGFLAPNRWHSEQGNIRKQNYLLPPLWGGAGGQSGDPAPNSITRYTKPRNTLGSVYKESYAEAPWRELGAIDQLLGGFVIRDEWQKRREFFKNVNVWTISRRTGAGGADSVENSVNCPDRANNQQLKMRQNLSLRLPHFA